MYLRVELTPQCGLRLPVSQHPIQPPLPLLLKEDPPSSPSPFLLFLLLRLVLFHFHLLLLDVAPFPSHTISMDQDSFPWAHPLPITSHSQRSARLQLLSFDHTPHHRLTLEPGLYKLFHPAIPDGRTQKTWKRWETSNIWPKTLSTYDSKYYIFKNQNTLIVHNMTENTLFYGFHGDGWKNLNICTWRTWSWVSSKWENIQPWIWFHSNVLHFFQVCPEQLSLDQWILS